MSEVIARWKYDFALLTAEECSTFAAELCAEKTPAPDPAVVLAAFDPYRDRQVDSYLLANPTWQLLYPMSEQQGREWTRNTFGHRLRQCVDAAWLVLRGP